MLLEDTRAAFTQTSWTLIDAIRGDDTARRADALAKLMQTYWPPVYAFLRRAGHSRNNAAELTQHFFAEKILERDLFATADAARGKLRSLLCKSVQNFVRNERARASERFNRSLITADAIEREEQLLSSASNLSQSDMFDRRWALAVMEEAMNRCERELPAEGKDAHWRAFEKVVRNPAVFNTAKPTYDEFASELGFKDSAVAAASVQLVKKRFKETLLQVIAESVTVNCVEDLNDEVRTVLDMLR